MKKKVIITVAGVLAYILFFMSIYYSKKENIRTQAVVFSSMMETHPDVCSFINMIYILYKDDDELNTLAKILFELQNYSDNIQWIQCLNDEEYNSFKVLLKKVGVPIE